MEALYTASAVSTGIGRVGESKLTDGSLDLIMAPPAALGGDGNGVNPEQLFALGYAACFHNALSRVGRRMKLDTEGSVVTAEVSIGVAGKGFGLAVVLKVLVPAVSFDEAKALTEAAHELCPYSNATRGNIDVFLVIENPTTEAAA